MLTGFLLLLKKRPILLLSTKHSSNVQTSRGTVIFLTELWTFRAVVIPVAFYEGIDSSCTWNVTRETTRLVGRPFFPRTLETNSSNLKMDGWKTIRLPFGKTSLLVSGRVTAISPLKTAGWKMIPFLFGKDSPSIFRCELAVGFRKKKNIHKNSHSGPVFFCIIYFCANFRLELASRMRSWKRQSSVAICWHFKQKLG